MDTSFALSLDSQTRVLSALHNLIAVSL